MLSNTWSWMLEHPQLLWVLVTCFITALMKPRTAEEYAAMPPHLASVLKLIAALGPDPVQALEAVKHLAGYAGPTPPAPTTVVAAAAEVIAAVETKAAP